MTEPERRGMSEEELFAQKLRQAINRADEDVNKRVDEWVRAAEKRICERVIGTAKSPDAKTAREEEELVDNNA